MKKTILFKTDNVDDSMFMSADLEVTEGIHKGTLLINLIPQGGDRVYFTLYDYGVKELSDFLIKYLEDNK